MTIAVNAVRNAIYSETIFERTKTFFIMLALLFGECIVCLDQSRLDIDSPAKFDLFKDTFL